MQKLTTEQLNSLSQKWHLTPHKLTIEEWDLIPQVRDWENISNQYNFECTDDDIDDFYKFESIFVSIYGIPAGLDPYRP